MWSLLSRFAGSPRWRQQIWYVPVLSLAMGLVLLRLLVLTSLLDVASFGAFSLGLLVSSAYCIVGTLGLLPLLQREWPMLLLRGRGRLGTLRASQCHLMGLGSATLAVLVIWVMVANAAAGRPLLVIALLHGLAQQAFLVSSTESRSAGDALRYARGQLLRALLVLLLGAATAALFGAAEAVLAVEAVATAVQAVLLMRSSIRRTRLSWAGAYWLAWRRLPKVPWSTALTVLLVTLVAFSLLNLDRWVASALLTPVAFAQYSFAAILLSVAQSLQALVNAAIYPLLARRAVGQGGQAAYAVCARLSAFMLLTGALLALPLGGLLSWGIGLAFPSYLEARALLPWLLAVGLLRLADFSSSFLLIVGQERRLLAVNLAACVLAGLLWTAWGGAQPDTARSPVEIARLAMLLAAASFLFTAVTAWRLRSARAARVMV